MAGEFHGTEIDVWGHVFSPRQIEESTASRMWETEDAPPNPSIVVPEWNPFVEHDTVPMRQTAMNLDVPLTLLQLRRYFLDQVCR